MFPESRKRIRETGLVYNSDDEDDDVRANTDGPHKRLRLSEESFVVDPILLQPEPSSSFVIEPTFRTPAVGEAITRRTRGQRGFPHSLPRPPSPIIPLLTESVPIWYDGLSHVPGMLFQNPAEHAAVEQAAITHNTHYPEDQHATVGGVASGAVAVQVPSRPPWLCPYVQCGRRGHIYTQKSALERHVKSRHLNIRDHVCDKCGSAFSRADVLKTKHLPICQGTPLGPSTSTTSPSPRSPHSPNDRKRSFKA